VSLSAVVKKEVHQSIRSYSVVGIAFFFFLFAVFLAAIRWIPVPYRSSPVARSTLVLLNSMRQSGVFFVPLLGLGIGYDAIAGERERGSLKLLLGLPNTRREAVLGKFVGRTLVVGGLVVACYTVVWVVTVLTYGSLDFATFGLYTLLTVCNGAVYVAVPLGFSAGMKSRQWALSAAIGLYALFMLGWDTLLFGLQLVLYGAQPPSGGLPDWFQLIGVFNPSTAFMFAGRAVIPAYHDLTIYPQSDAVFLQDWVGFVVLLVWVVAPLVLGYRRFEKMDIE
jgi:ABC-2 type transport system permease protein